MLARLGALLLLSLLAALAGYAAASVTSGAAQECRTTEGGHWLVFQQSCRF